jgi:hypothetical protein
MTFPARSAVAVGAKVSMWPIRLLKIGSVRGEMDKGGSGNKKKPKGLNAENNRRIGFAGVRLFDLVFVCETERTPTQVAQRRPAWSREVI